MDLISPDQTSATVYIPKDDREITQVMVNEKVVWKKGNFQDKVNEIKGLKTDDDYIVFEVEDGIWNFKALSK